MLRSIVAAAALLALPVLAGDELVWKDGNVTIRFTLESCPSPELMMALMANGIEPPFRVATVHHNGTMVPACYGSMDADKLLLIDVYSRGGYVMRDQLKAEPGV